MNINRRSLLYELIISNKRTLIHTTGGKDEELVWGCD